MAVLANTSRPIIQNSDHKTLKYLVNNNLILLIYNVSNKNSLLSSLSALKIRSRIIRQRLYSYSDKSYSWVRRCLFPSWYKISATIGIISCL